MGIVGEDVGKYQEKGVLWFVFELGGHVSYQ